MDFASFFAAAEKNLPLALLAACVIALAWLVRDRLAAERTHAAELKASYDAHLQTAIQVAPLAAKLASCVEILERLMTHRGS